MKNGPIAIGEGYSAEFDTVGKHDWYQMLSRFSDANIYQTWSYDAIRCGEDKLSHFVLHKGAEAIAAAQLRIVRIPILGIGAAYVRWGPLWQLRGQPRDPAVFRMALRAMRNEYVFRRGLILRIFPLLFEEEDSEVFVEVLSQEGYVPVSGEDKGRTFIVDISHPIEDLRKKLDQKWRNCLNKAERNQLEVTEGHSDNLFADFIGIYRALLDRKKFEEPNDINEFRRIQEDLPPEHRMRIFLCGSNGESSAGAICATVGDAGVYLFGATNNEGMANKGSYLLQWKAIEWMKNNGCRSYNLNGINPQKNPGSYHFKAGLSGKNGRDLYYLGRFDAYSGGILAKLARTGDLILPVVRKVVGRLSVTR